MKRPAPVTDLLTSLLRGTPAELRLREGRIWEVWEEAVGGKIAAHAQPASFREGTLTLHVDSSPWLQQLNYLKKDLIAKVNEALDEELVQEIQLKGGKVKSSAPNPQQTVKRRKLSENEQTWIKEQADSIPDPELRAVFENLIRKDREHQEKG
jgi:predicted nucleic acid-binding Zn ribbon protein